jgi:hypothetical protein
MWIVEQRDPAGDGLPRVTVHEQQEAERYARLYKAHNPRLRFRYRPLTTTATPSTTANR